MTKKGYSREFFAGDLDSVRSARHIVPVLMELVNPSSVADVGCGTGDFLSVFMEHGVKDVLGVDGEWVRQGLKIPGDLFVPADLEKPFAAGRKFDLVLSLEVAEHLDESAAEEFIGTLTGLGPAVLFSAAVPFQGGRNHLNERWQEYWAELFLSRGYVPADCLRKRIWDNEEVDYWYAQNALFYVSREALAEYPKLEKAAESPEPPVLSMVHPGLYLKKASKRFPARRRFLSPGKARAGSVYTLMAGRKKRR